MNNPRLEITFDLVAAIKFSAKNDGILVPIYSCYPKNEYFVAQTDDSMMIRHFSDHWPPDLEKKLSRMVMAHQKELNSALSERRAIMETIERGRKDGAHRFDRHAVHRRVATLSLQILTTVKFLDVLRKSLLSGEELERSGGTLHDVDYSGLGLNQDFFMNLGNSDENA